MDVVLDVLGELRSWSYVIVGLMAFLEASAFVGLLAPGETVVVVAGFLAGQRYLSVAGVAASASVGAALGDTVGYELGHHFGRRFIERYAAQLPRWRHALERTESFFARHGGKAVFLGRFVGFLRAFAPFVAGVSRMPYGRFLLYNVTGGVVWATAFTLLGYFAGANWPAIERWAGWIAAAVAVAAALVLWLRYRAGAEAG